MGREVRRVPANWEHPKQRDQYRDEERYRPMYQRSFEDAYAEWEKDLAEWFGDYARWEAGTYEIEPEMRREYRTYEAWAGAPPSPPNPYDYMPTGDWWQLFEDTSEGTPLSPPFATADELVDWLTHNPDFWGRQWPPESARAIVERGWAPSFMFSPSTGLRSPEEFMADAPAPP